jgi:hypothetical protein
VYNLADKNAVRRMALCARAARGHIAAAVVAGRRPVSFSVPPPPGNKVALCFSVRAPTRNNFYASEREELFIKIQSTNRRGGPKGKVLPRRHNCGN